MFTVENNKRYILWACLWRWLSSTQSAWASLCCHVRPLRLYHVFTHYLVNGTIFGIKLLNTKCVLIFYTTFVRSVSYHKKTDRDVIINVRGSSCEAPFILVRF